MTRILLDPADFQDIIRAAVDETVRRIREERPRDELGKILVPKPEAADLMGVSQGTIDRWRAEAGLPSVKINGKVLFRPTSLKEWAVAREATS